MRIVKRKDGLFYIERYEDPRRFLFWTIKGRWVGCVTDNYFIKDYRIETGFKSLKAAKEFLANPPRDEVVFES